MPYPLRFPSTHSFLHGVRGRAEVLPDEDSAELELAHAEPSGRLEGTGVAWVRLKNPSWFSRVSVTVHWEE